ncbi:MAG: choice-of-anchor D domain-containing protein, partial [Acidobacteriota bacterium]
EGRWGYGQVKVIATAGSYAYFVSGTVLEVADITTPAAPTVVGRLLLAGVPTDIAVSGSYILVGTEAAGLRVIDVSTPASPVEAGAYSGVQMVWGVAAAGGYAYIGTSNADLRVLDISSPASPTFVADCHVTGPINDIAIAGNYAYVASGAGRLHVVDIAAPATPVLAGTVNLPAAARAVAVAGAYAYVTAGWSLQVVDVATPSSPALLGSALALPRLAFGVALYGSYALVADDTSGLRVIDISTPGTPSAAGFLDTAGAARGVAISGSHAYVADHGDGVRVVSLAAPASLVEVGHLDSPDESRGIAIAGNYAYVANQMQGLRILDISDPASPSEAGFLATANLAADVAVSGAYAYVADQAALHIIDVSTPSSPTQVGAYSGLQNFYGVAVSGGYAYLAVRDRGLDIIDVSTPASPAWKATLDTPGDAYGVAVFGGFAFVADGNEGLFVANCANPQSPTEAGRLDTPGFALGVAVSGGVAYVADQLGGLQIIDVSDPTNPTAVTSLATSSADGVAVFGNRVFVADHASGLRVISIADPSSPEEVGRYDTAGTAYGVAVSDGLVGVADRLAGAAFFTHADCPDTACELTCTASPSVTSGPAPLAVDFTAEVTATDCTVAITHSWDYGDGSALSTEQNPSHTYTSTGAKSWTYTATSGPASCTQSGSITVTAPEITVLDGLTPLTDGQAAVVSFGTVVQGSAGAPRTFTVQNNGAATLTLGTLTVPAGFVVVEGLVASLAAGNSDTFTVALDTAAAAIRSGGISITNNDGNENPFNFPVAGTVAAAPPRRLDFGTTTSVVASGYTRATTTSAYTAALGWGWFSGTVTARDRGAGFSDLNRDFVYTTNATFLVDLPNGAWDVTVTMGDGTNPHDQMGVYLEGTLAATITSTTGQFQTRTLRTTLADNQLTVQLQDLGGSDANTVINALLITPAPPFRFDFGTATSPVASGYTRVSEATNYSALLAYGWRNGQVQSRDRATGSDLTRDLNFTTSAGFGADLAPGVYDVTVTMGDATNRHDQMGVWFEGGTATLVTANAGQFQTVSARVTLTDGELTMGLSDYGGSDAYVVINALTVAPASYKFDFGTATSPVATGYSQVTHATTYNAIRSYGWLSGTIQSRDRATG